MGNLSRHTERCIKTIGVQKEASDLNKFGFTTGEAPPPEVRVNGYREEFD